MLTVTQKNTLDKIVNVHTIKPPMTVIWYLAVDGKKISIAEEQYRTILYGSEKDKVALIDVFNKVTKSDVKEVKLEDTEG